MLQSPHSAVKYSASEIHIAAETHYDMLAGTYRIPSTHPFRFTKYNRHELVRNTEVAILPTWP